MTAENTSYLEPVATLLTLGRTPLDQIPWVDYQRYGLTLEHVPELLRLMVDRQFDECEEDEPELWALYHAWRALGQLRAEAAIPVLVGMLDQADDEGGNEWVMDELPLVLAMIGPTVFPAVDAYARSVAKGAWGRNTACAALVALAGSFPEMRDACVQSLTAVLTHYAANDEFLNAMVISNLVDLNAAEAAPVMQAAFAANRVALDLGGDWEEVQIALGLLDERITPKPNWFQVERERIAQGLPKDERPAADRQQTAAERKRKQARKQAKETKKKQRSPKKKKR